MVLESLLSQQKSSLDFITSLEEIKDILKGFCCEKN